MRNVLKVMLTCLSLPFFSLHLYANEPSLIQATTITRENFAKIAETNTSYAFALSEIRKTRDLGVVWFMGLDGKKLYAVQGVHKIYEFDLATQKPPISWGLNFNQHSTIMASEIPQASVEIANSGYKLVYWPVTDPSEAKSGDSNLYLDGHIDLKKRAAVLSLIPCG